MVDYATVFGALFLIATVVLTYWITRISLEGDAHGPATNRSDEDDAEASSG